MGNSEGGVRPKACQRCGRTYCGGGYKFCSRECMLGAGVCKRCGREFQRGFAGQRFCRGCHGSSGEKVCPGCGETFRQATPDRVYCSKECYERSRAHVPKPCPVRGKGVPKGRKYCSDACKYRANGTIHVCQQCGREFHRANDPDRATKFCSQKCQWEAQKKREDCTCQVCGKVFHPHNMALGLFCSRQCSSVALRSKSCPVCGAWVSADSGRTYCSDACRETAEKERIAERKREALGYEREFDDALEWMAWLSDRRIEEAECEICGEAFMPGRAFAKYCPSCRKYLSNHHREQRLYRNGKPDLSISLKGVYRRDKGYCRGCGRHLEFMEDFNSDDYPSIDHIMPLAKGGLHRWDNVQLMCRGCNRRKRDAIEPVHARSFQTRLEV